MHTLSLIETLTTPWKWVLSPRMFQRPFFAASSASGTHVVLPEGTEPRIFRATAEILLCGVRRSAPSGEPVAADAGGVTLLGVPCEVYAAADAARANLDGAAVVDPTDANSSAFWRYADRLAELRAHKGVTVTKAVGALWFDVNLYGTLMVEAGGRVGEGVWRRACDRRYHPTCTAADLGRHPRRRRILCFPHASPVRVAGVQ